MESREVWRLSIGNFGVCLIETSAMFHIGNVGPSQWRILRRSSPRGPDRYRAAFGNGTDVRHRGSCAGHAISNWIAAHDITRPTANAVATIYRCMVAILPICHRRPTVEQSDGTTALQIQLR